MLPQSRCVRLLEVPMMRQLFLDEFVGQDAGLRQSVHSFADIHVNVAIKDFFEVDNVQLCHRVEVQLVFSCIQINQGVSRGTCF
jgi:hypothetical protein